MINPSGHADRARRNRGRILVVDDQEEIRELARMVLDGEGYGVATAASGLDALDALLREPFDLVLLDINMPDMDGWETLRMLRAAEQLTALRVMMFSVKGEVRDKIQSLQEGADDYLAKPFEVDDLLGRVRRLLDERAH